MKPGSDELERGLLLLEARGAAPVDLVVCGGAALRMAGIVGRVTKDVDVLARRGEVDREIMEAWPLPDHVKEAAARVWGECPAGSADLAADPRGRLRGGDFSGHRVVLEVGAGDPE